VQAKFALETELQATKSSLTSAMADRESLLKELDKLREDRDDHERKQIVLSNRLNAAKKQEAAKANLAESLEDSVKVLKYDLEKTQVALKEVAATKEKLTEELKTSSEDYENRIKRLDILLGEERRHNEDRKKKMKAFVENKQEEVREAKSQNDELNMKLSQTNRSLREHHARWKQLHEQWVHLKLAIENSSVISIA
jgi:chromosome segregation ATPase